LPITHGNGIQFANAKYMIRFATDDGWCLIAHQDHARLAGEFARCWNNAAFAPPQPIEDILVAVSRHDDAWAPRDACPEIAPDKTPSAFSSELVGTYSAFENIDLENYLKVRGAATEAVAADNPVAATLVSMHTVNLLTEQADLSTLSAKDKILHQAFIESQLQRQSELKSSVSKERYLSHEQWEDAFKFLQACDSFSLIACVNYTEALPLRHQHKTREGKIVDIICEPLDAGAFRLSPYPLAQDVCQFRIQARRIRGKTFSTNEELQTAYANGEVFELIIKAII
jgi:hypothetical protein